MKTDGWIVGSGIHHSDGDIEQWPWKLIIVIAVVMIAAFLFAFLSGAWGVQRYPIGQSVPSSVYTEPYDPCDPAYKFLQAPPADWTEKFGNNERTMLLHAVSELRVVVANQSKRILALEEWQKKQPVWDPNNVGVDLRSQQIIAPQKIDPNEAKQ